MFYLFITVFLTLAVSSMCSIFEAVILGTTPLEVESLKKRAPNRGVILENLVAEIDKTTSSILAANTIANTFGATLAGSQFAFLFGADMGAKYVFPAAMTVSILVFSEILPKNLAIFYRRRLQRAVAYPLYWLCILMTPVARATSLLIASITPRRARPHEGGGDDEIILLAEKGRKDGLISSQERDLIANSLSLDDITIAEIMTPRTVVFALDESMTAEQAFKMEGGLKFSRMPIYRDSIDNITGVVRRRAIITAVADGRGGTRISQLATPAMYVPENGSALAVLRQFVKKHRQLGIVVDEFSSLTGVVSLEDIFEHILGSEIFDNTDVAVDMRELARRKRNLQNRKK